MVEKDEEIQRLKEILKSVQPQNVSKNISFLLGS